MKEDFEIIGLPRQLKQYPHILSFSIKDPNNKIMSRRKGKYWTPFPNEKMAAKIMKLLENDS